MPRIGADSEALTKAESIPWKMKIIPRDARSRSDMVGGLLPDRRLTEISPAIKFSPIEQHLSKSRVIGDGREQARAPPIPSPDLPDAPSPPLAKNVVAAFDTC
jgi:hypothetical protein